MAVPKASKVPEKICEPVNPVQLPKLAPEPSSTVKLRFVPKPLVCVKEEPYSFTADGKVPEDVTAIQRCPVCPGRRLVTLNIAVPESSSLSRTVPVAQLLFGFCVVAVNAQYEACHTRAALTTNASGIVAQRTTCLAHAFVTNIGIPSRR